jgi:mannose-6-phosphate isomerase-like protein (cupin superfamily)
MKAQTTFAIALLPLVMAAKVGITVVSQDSTAKATLNGGSGWTVKLNETRGPVRAADTSSPLGKVAVSEILAGPTNGSDAAYLIFTRMPSRAHGPALSTLQDDHYYLVLEGKMNIEIGTDTFVVETHQAAVIPPGVPHEVWNDGPEPEAHLEIIAPGSSRDLKAMFKAAQPHKVENSATYIRTPRIPTQAEMKPGLNGAMFAERKTGGNEQMRIDSTLPGQGGPKPHVHKFEQVYFEIEGSTDLTYGLNTYPLPKYSIAIVQPGAVHTNGNKTASVERHITLLLPEPKDQSEPLDVEVEFKGGVGTRR